MKSDISGVLLSCLLVSLGMTVTAQAKPRPTISSVSDGVSCLKPDGDWVDGVTRRECKSLHGVWRHT